MDPRPLVAVVDDDAAFTMLVQDFLEGEGYATLLLHEAHGAAAKLAAAHPAVILLDVRLEHPDSGDALLRELRALRETRLIPIIICTADQIFLREHRLEIARQRACVLPKPFDLEDLLHLVRTCVSTTPTREGRNDDGRGTAT